MAAAARTIFILIYSVVVVFARLIVSCMTACASRLVGRRRPQDDLRVGLMAICTLQIAAVVQRFVSEPGVTVITRYPGVRNMAQAAILYRVEVVRSLARSCNTVVTAGTGSKHLVVIDGSDRRPYRGVVAILADVRCLHVHWPLAGCVGTVMAAETIIRDVRVIEIRWRPGDSSMAIIAIVPAGNMRRMLARRGYTVVTRAA